MAFSTLGLAALAMLATADDGPARINLVCYGEGTKKAPETKYGYEWDKDKKKYESTRRTEYEEKAFDATVKVEIAGNMGRIHLTGKLVPPIHSGGSDGWWPLEKLNVFDDRITARYRLNGLNKPKVSIDRMSGRINIDGLEDFRGNCEAADDQERKF
ncbi:MAG: hypothetical protein EP335_13040 [Alphaproteobacteria bacterium]|nr:MAG: hypothetical protein EP335_13040 [Alphaproteobacteria bacterium]